MARANLELSKEVERHFTSALEPTSTVRAIKLVINDEKINYHSSLAISGTSPHDLDNNIQSIVRDSEAAFILYRLADRADEKGRKWLLIAWIPGKVLLTR